MIPSILSVPLYNYSGVIWTAVVAAILIGLAIHIKRLNNYFPNKGIKSLPTYVPFFGNGLKLFLQREHLMDFAQNLYKSMPEEKYFGFRSFGSPPLVIIKDLDIIKQVGVKDFDYFIDHTNQISEDVDPLFGNNLMASKGQKWREMRATLSPAFTSSKMRGMFDFVSECGNQMAKFFLNESKKPEYDDKQYIEIELKDTFTRYTNDVIATAAFGINVNSLRDSDNEFYIMGKKATSFKGLALIKFLLILVAPRLMKFFDIAVLDRKVSQFFRDLVNNSMKMREEKGIVRPDMIHLLMEAKKGSLKHETTKIESKEVGFATVEESEMGKETNKTVWSNDQLIAQAVIFFLAGFETSSNLLSFIGYELAKNPDIQKRLQQEIDEVAEKNNGKVKYDPQQTF